MDIDAILNGLVDGTDIDAAALLMALASRISARKSGERVDGRGAGMDVQLANGQEFRISIEEL